MSATATPTASEVQEQVLDGIRQSQHAVVETVRVLSDAAGKLTPSLPGAGQELPDAGELVASSFDFAEKLLASQREFVQELLAAVK